MNNIIKLGTAELESYQFFNFITDNIKRKENKDCFLDDIYNNLKITYVDTEFNQDYLINVLNIEFNDNTYNFRVLTTYNGFKRYVKNWFEILPLDKKQRQLIEINL